jgi:hypothetical protein
MKKRQKQTKNKQKRKREEDKKKHKKLSRSQLLQIIRTSRTFRFCPNMAAQSSQFQMLECLRLTAKLSCHTYANTLKVVIHLVGAL